MNGNAEGSTLRLTLGCLRSKELGIELRRVGSGTRLTFCDSERLISKWLEENALVAWATCLEPWAVEEELIRNLETSTEFGPEQSASVQSWLTAIRSAARNAARQAPIWLPSSVKGEEK